MDVILSEVDRTNSFDMNNNPCNLDRQFRDRFSTTRKVYRLWEYARVRKSIKSQKFKTILLVDASEICRIWRRREKKEMTMENTSVYYWREEECKFFLLPFSFLVRRKETIEPDTMLYSSSEITFLFLSCLSRYEILLWKREKKPWEILFHWFNSSFSIC